MSQIVLDIDGTLADATHRLHLLPKRAAEDLDRPTEAEWAAFMAPELVAQDTYNHDVWYAVRGLALMSLHPPLIFTGRRDSLRDVTMKWLSFGSGLFDVAPWFDRAILMMRADGDRRASWQVKRDHLAWARENGHTPTVAFEDRARDAAMYREHGLTCFQVAEGRY